jgi:hypothetical protein
MVWASGRAVAPCTECREHSTNHRYKRPCDALNLLDRACIAESHRLNPRRSPCSNLPSIDSRRAFARSSSCTLVSFVDYIGLRWGCSSRLDRKCAGSHRHRTLDDRNLQLQIKVVEINLFSRSCSSSTYSLPSPLEALINADPSW